MRASAYEYGVALVVPLAIGVRGPAAAQAEPEKAEPPTLDVTSWTDRTRALHGVSAARRRLRRSGSPCT